MKAKDYNGTIKIFKRVPKSYGNIIGGFDLLSDAELQTHGFYNVNRPSINETTQTLGAIYFNSSANEFTYPVVDKTWTRTLDELKEERIDEAKSIANAELYKTDWIIIRDKELGNTTAQATLDARAAIRTACANHETAINSKTEKADVVAYAITY